MAFSGFAETPRDQRNYRHSYREYQEAVAEVGDHYETRRRNGEPVREPDYAAVAMAQAKGA